MSRRPFDLSVIDFEARRHERRKKLFKIGVIPMVIILIVALKLLSVPVMSGLGQNYFDMDDGKSAATSYSVLGFANFLEKYKAPFNKATSLLLDGQSKAAQAIFEDILPLVPSGMECAVRVNLSLTVERQADEKHSNKKYDDAITLYSYALETVIHGGCVDYSATSDKSDFNESTKEKAKQIAERLSDKADITKQERNDDGSDPVTSSESNGKQSDIERKFKKLTEEDLGATIERNKQQRSDDAANREKSKNENNAKPW